MFKRRGPYRAAGYREAAMEIVQAWLVTEV